MTFLTGQKHDRIRPHSGDTAQSPGHSTQPRRGAHVRKHAREMCHEERSSRPRFAPHSAAEKPSEQPHPRRGAHVWKHAREVHHEESRSRLRIAPHSAGEAGEERRGREARLTCRSAPRVPRRRWECVRSGVRAPLCARAERILVPPDCSVSTRARGLARLRRYARVLISRRG